MLNIFSTNAAGLKAKVESCKYEIKDTNAAIFTIQETHFEKKGKFRVEGFEVFESIRKNKKDGGTLIGVHNALQPVLIQEYSEQFELIVVEVNISGRELRIISGYGPQESWPEEERLPFFLALEEEINKAEMLGKSIVIQMDANSKLGTEFVENDPHVQSPNGHILSEIIIRHGLIVGNGLKTKCTGLITRKRVTKEATEESVIDFVIVSSDIEDSIESINIDEERNHVLTRYTKTKAGVKKVESDHNPIISKLKFCWSKSQQKQREEIFNFNNDKSLKMFKDLTTNTNFLSSVFDSHKDLNILTKKFLKRLNGCLHQCFKKIKISGNGNKEIDELFNRRKVLKTKVDDKSREELENIEKELANKCANNNYIKIKNEIAGIKCEEGGIHSGKLWKLRKKLFPRSRDPPTAMLDGTGNLVTSQEKIEAIALETYQKRLENRDIIENLSDIKTEKEDLCARRLEVAALNKTPEWSIEDLQKVLKYLKLNKSRDPLGYANEIFRPEVAGDDLQLAILKL